MKKSVLSFAVVVATVASAFAVTPLPEALAKLPVEKGTKRVAKELKPGVTYHQVHFENFTGDGPLAAYFLVIDWTKVGKDFSLAVVPGKDGNRSRPTDLANETKGAFAAVNGVFHEMKDPYTAFYARKIDGVVSKSKHEGGDGCFAFNRGEMPYIGRFTKEAFAKYANVISADGMPGYNKKEATMTPAERQKLRAPRTNAGNVSSNKVTVIAVADGRQKRSTGLSYSEARKLLEMWGCDQMTNLDGGGSSVMAVKASVGAKPTMTNGKFKIMNVPSDGLPIMSVERRVSESLMLLDK